MIGGVLSMFEGISFVHTETNRPLTSRNVSDEALRSGKYDPENLANSEFYIEGAADFFHLPPMTPYAQENLFHAQAFTVFYYKKGSFTRRQNFRSFLILYTHEGTGEVEYDGRKYILRPGDGIWIDCRKAHYYVAKEDWKVVAFHFQGPLAQHMQEELEMNGGVSFHEGASGRFHRYFEKLLAIYSAPSLHRDFRASHCISGMLLYLLLLNANTATDDLNVPDSIQLAMKYLESNYQSPVTLDKLAQLTKSNKYHLVKAFKRYTGFSPHDYLICLRINQAKLLLRSTTLPANKIAHEVGIHDINNFNYLFKNRVGMTPIQYRNNTDYIL